MLDNVVIITCIRLVFSYMGSGIALPSYHSYTVRCNKEIATDTMQPEATESVAEVVTEHSQQYVRRCCIYLPKLYVAWTQLCVGPNRCVLD